MHTHFSIRTHTHEIFVATFFMLEFLHINFGMLPWFLFGVSHIILFFIQFYCCCVNKSRAIVKSRRYPGSFSLNGMFCLTKWENQNFKNTVEHIVHKCISQRTSFSVALKKWKMPLCHKDVTINWNRRIECNTLNGKLTSRFIYLAKHFAHTHKFFLYPWKLWYTQLWLEAIFYVWFPVLF